MLFVPCRAPHYTTNHPVAAQALVAKGWVNSAEPWCCSGMDPPTYRTFYGTRHIQVANAIAPSLSSHRKEMAPVSRSKCPAMVKTELAFLQALTHASSMFMPQGCHKWVQDRAVVRSLRLGVSTWHAVVVGVQCVSSLPAIMTAQLLAITSTCAACS